MRRRSPHHETGCLRLIPNAPRFRQAFVGTRIPAIRMSTRGWRFRILFRTGLVCESLTGPRRFTRGDQARRGRSVRIAVLPDRDGRVPGCAARGPQTISSVRKFRHPPLLGPWRAIDSVPRSDPYLRPPPTRSPSSTTPSTRPRSPPGSSPRGCPGPRPSRRSRRPQAGPGRRRARVGGPGPVR
jgi:hypothetical protein